MLRLQLVKAQRRQTRRAVVEALLPSVQWQSQEMPSVHETASEKVVAEVQRVPQHLNLQPATTQPRQYYGNRQCGKCPTFLFTQRFCSLS